MTSMTSRADAMSYRERVAWLSLFAMAATLGPYLAMTAMDSAAGNAIGHTSLLIRFGTAASANALILGAGHLILRLRFTEDAGAPADERDRAIELRSTRAAYYVLIVAMIVVGIVMPFSEEGWGIVNAAVGAVFLAELVHYGMAVHSYRRGWHH